jgi:sulfite exporter TauE/SafE
MLLLRNIFLPCGLVLFFAIDARKGNSERSGQVVLFVRRLAKSVTKNETMGGLRGRIEQY